ncbi:hypothetical protein WMF04_17395 [Sorangium sp. So ce260]
MKIIIKFKRILAGSEGGLVAGAIWRQLSFRGAGCRAFRGVACGGGRRS